MAAIPESVAVEARAKIVWGATPDAVLKFLMSEKVEAKDALALLKEILTERAEMIRSEGVMKIWTGALLVLVPVGYLLVSLVLGFLVIGLFAVLIFVGLFGVARAANGIFMVRNARTIEGDLSNANGF